MSKSMSNEEIKALYNEIESLKIESQRKIKQETQRIYGYVSSENIAKAYPKVSHEIIEWIFGKKEFSEINQHLHIKALEFLYSNQRHSNERNSAVISFLQATEDPKLIEIASKMLLFDKNLDSYFDIRTREKINIASIMLLQSYDTVSIDNSFYYRGIHYTLSKEIKEIKKRTRKASQKDAKNIKKFKNISDIDISILYDAIIMFLRQHGRYPSSLSTGDQINEYLQNHITEIVQSNQFEAIDMLYNNEELSFARKQKVGKIR